MSNCAGKNGKEREKHGGRNGKENCKGENGSDSDDEKNWELCSAAEHDKKFDPKEYLDGFYRTASEDTAMQVVLFFLPGIVYYLPETITTLLDLGAGPTVYVPIVFRNRARNIYSADYAEMNRNTVQSWYEGRCCFDWSKVCEWISAIELSNEGIEGMQRSTRQRLRAILKANVHSAEVIEAVHCKCTAGEEMVPRRFQVIVTIFCLEYACETLEDYRRAVRNTTRLIEPGGYLVQGGIFNAKEYSFGGKRFRCHTLTKEQLLATLRENQMEADRKPDFKLIVYDDVFIMISKKLQ